MYRPVYTTYSKICAVVLIFEFKVKINVFWVPGKKFGENPIQKLISGKNTEFWPQTCSTKKPSDAKMLELDLIGFVACTRILVPGQRSRLFFVLAGLSD